MRDITKKFSIFGLMSSASENDFSLVKKAVLGMDKVHPYLRNLNGNSFKLMKNSDEMIAEIHSLEEMSRVLEIAPAEAIRFHVNGKNDFAIWIREIVGNESLGEKIDAIQFESLEEMRWKLVSTIYNEIVSIKLSQLHADDL